MSAEPSRFGFIVQRQRLVANDGKHCRRMFAVSAGIGAALNIDYLDDPVPVGAHPDFEACGMAAVGSNEGFFSFIDDFGRLAGFQRDNRRIYFGHPRLLGAKPTANPRLDNPDARGRNLESPRQLTPHMKRNLRRADDDQTSRLIQLRESPKRFHHGLRLRLRPVGLFHYHLAPGQFRLYIAIFRGVAGSDIAFPFQTNREVACQVVLRMDNRRVIDRGIEIQNRFKNFIVDFDQIQRRQRCLFVDSGYDRHFIADITHPLIQNQTIIGGRLRIRLPRLSESDLRHILMGQDAFHAGQGLGGGSVD